MYQCRYSRSAFTLIEILVVIGIVAVSAATLFPVFARSKEFSKAASSLVNVKQIGIANQMYMAENDDTMPYALYRKENGIYDLIFPTLMEALDPYCKNKDVWLSPTGSQDVADYTKKCGSSDTVYRPTVVSHYVWPSWFTWVRWGMAETSRLGDNGAVGFGFPANPFPGQDGNAKGCLKATSYQECRGLQQAEQPASTAWLVGGAYISYKPESGPASLLRFGSYCEAIIGAPKNWLKRESVDTKLNYHHEGFNAGFGDGHARWVSARAFYFDRSIPAPAPTMNVNKYTQIVSK